MRYLLTAMLTAMLTTVVAQEPALMDTLKPYERIEIVKLDSTRDADELYRAAKRCLVDAFRDVQEVIQVDDSATHTIVGKGNFKYEAWVGMSASDKDSRNGSVGFFVEIITKDGRYRVRLYDFRHEGSQVKIGGFSEPQNLGLIYNNRTYCSRKYTWDGEPTKHQRRVCQEEVWPSIHEYGDKLLAKIKETMAQAKNAQGSSSDW